MVDLMISDFFKQMNDEKEDGFGGMDFDLEEYDLENHDEFISKIKKILNVLEYQFTYYGDDEEGRRAHHNFNGEFVGHILSIHWE
jgi:hypothetical protein